MSRRAITSAAAAFAAALTIPAAAQAADWYLSPTGSNANTCGSSDPCQTIAYVAGLAAVHDGDTIHLAAGTYNESVTVTKQLTLVGAGSGTPISDAGASLVQGTGLVALRLTDGGAVRNLRLKGHDGSGTSGAALVLDDSGATPKTYDVSGVIAIGGRDTAAGTSRDGILMNEDPLTTGFTATVEDSYVSSPINGDAIALDGDSHASLTLTRTLLSAPGPQGRGVDADIGPSVTLLDSQVLPGTGAYGGIATYGPTTIVGSTINGGNFGVFAGAKSLTVRDSLIVAQPASSSWEAIDLDDADATTPMQVLIEGSTVVTRGTDAGHSAIDIQAAASGASDNVQLVNSIFRVAGPDGTPAGHDLRAETVSGGTVSVTASHSSFSTIGTPGVLPQPGSGTNFTGDPGFTSFADGDYSLTPTSPLVDAGDPSAVQAGEVDLAGQPRALDGNGDCVALPDVGALELTGHAGSPPAVSVTGPSLARPGRALTFSAAAPAGNSLTWTFTGGGTATGSTVSHTFTAAGTQTATVTAAHGACVASASRSVTIDGTPPAISGLKVKKRRVRFRLSEAAAVKIVLQRRTGKHYRTVTTIRATESAGSHSVKLPAKVHGRKLKKGRYRVTVTATDAAGNVSKASRASFRI